MAVLTCVVILLALLLPLHWAVIRELGFWESPEYFRRFGVIVRRAEALDEMAEVIGSYRGAVIYRTVTFKGMAYEFSGVVPTGYEKRVDENELYIEPGLLYVTRGN
jgi:hypothetical protein